MAQFTYKFHPSNTTIYRQPIGAVSGGDADYPACVCYQVEYKKFLKKDGTIGTKLSYLILLDGSNTTQVVSEAELTTVRNAPNTPANPLPDPVFFEFDPGASVYVIDRSINSVRGGEVYHVEVKIHKDVDTGTTSRHQKVVYHVHYNDETGTVAAKEEDVWVSSEAAWLVLTGQPTPTPTLPGATPTPTPVPSDTNSIRVSKKNGWTSTILAGMPVYIVEGTDMVKPTDAKFNTTLSFLGFAFSDIDPGASGLIVTEGTVVLEPATQWGNIVKNPGINYPGLTVGKRYYLAATDSNPAGADGTGKITDIPPAEGYVKQIGIASSPNELDLRFGHIIKL